jgi:hypothetical protein
MSYLFLNPRNSPLGEQEKSLESSNHKNVANLLRQGSIKNLGNCKARALKLACTDE